MARDFFGHDASQAFFDRFTRLQLVSHGPEPDADSRPRQVQEVFPAAQPNTTDRTKPCTGKSSQRLRRIPPRFIELAARGASPAAFDRPGIPAGGVAPRSDIARYSSLVAPCPPGTGPVSVRRRTCTTGC